MTLVAKRMMSVEEFHEFGPKSITLNVDDKRI